VGGGIRSRETIQRLLNQGVQRVILGTAAVEKPEFVQEACQQFGEAIIISLDAREGYVAIHGWQRTTRNRAGEIGEKLEKLGVKRFIYTDIQRDGTLTQPDFATLTELLQRLRTPLIASGGISTIAHLVRLAQLGLEGAIVGRALYTGDIDLPEALKVVAKQA
jgi:phosphoribosylformimino-5-aminoimidazole carboxamide ribotide isomerase